MTASSAENKMSYNRARLILGMTSVGFWVVLSTVLLAFQIQIDTLLKVYLLISLPFDIVGGQILPRAFGRKTPSVANWILTYMRSVAIHTLVLVASCTLLFLASQLHLLKAGALLTMLLLLRFRFPLAQLSGSVKKLSQSSFEGRDVVSVDSNTPDFSGGVVGQGRGVQLLIPSAWTQQMKEVATVRRKIVLAEGGYNLGALVALSWNFLGIILLAPASPLTSTSLSRLVLSMTLWTFLGLLCLPSLSRKATLWADARTRRRLGTPALTQYLECTLDETEEAHPVSEPVFYPIPGKKQRLEELQKAEPTTLPRPWECARTALYLSVGSPSLLSRAVHCNVGRPALWFFPPCD